MTHGSIVQAASRLGAILESISNMLSWIVIAHGGGARIFRSRGPGAPLELERKLDNPSARVRDRNLDSDKAGRFDKPSRTKTLRSAADPERDSHALQIEHFARELVTILDNAGSRHVYDTLLLVAEPKFLGLLRDGVGAQTRKKVIVAMARDLSAISDVDLPQHLSELTEAWAAGALAAQAS